MIFPKFIYFLRAVSFLIPLQAGLAHGQSVVPTPEEFIGFEVGSDGMLFGWGKVIDYFNLLEAQTERMHVQQLGESTLGNPFVMAIISSPMNLKNLAKYRNFQRQAAYPRGLSDEDARQLAHLNKAVVMVVLNSNDLASGQGSIELAYLLTTQKTPQIKHILEQTIILLIPSANPDGLQRTVWWYNQFLNTPHEGSPLPYLAHNYAGKEIKLDWVQGNLQETRFLLEQIYEKWFPEVIYSQQSKAFDGARQVLLTQMPGNAAVPPRLFNQINNFSDHIARELRLQNFRGVVKQVPGTWGSESSVGQFWRHNIVGIISKTAPTRMATALYFPIGSVSAPRESHHPAIGITANWPGGWWRLRNIIEYELATIVAVLGHVAQMKESIIYDFCKMNMEGIAKGTEQAPFAFVVPRLQRDPVSLLQMLKMLGRAGIEIHTATDDFWADGKKYSKGDLVISLAQPFRAYIIDLLESLEDTNPDKSDGRSVRAGGDFASLNLPLMLGVNVVRIEEPFDANLIKFDGESFAKYKTTGTQGNYVIRNKNNQVAPFINRLLKENRKVFWLKNAQEIAGRHYQAGSLYLPEKEMKKVVMAELEQGLVLEVEQTRQSFEGQPAYRLRRAKLGLYQPWTANIDEGWTRLVLEKFEFSYRTIHSAKIISGKLRGDFDAIIIPDMTSDEILNGLRILRPNIYTPSLPGTYQGGVGSRGVDNLRKFVRKGGTLIVLDSACDLIIEQFGLPVENVLKDVDSSEFSCPESLLEIVVNNTEPIAYGMPQRLAAFFRNSPAFRPFYWTRRTGVIASYPEKSLLLSGFISGDEKIRGLSAAVEIPMGKGRVVLFGFKVQGRGQTVATFKLLFNAIYASRAEAVILRK